MKKRFVIIAQAVLFVWFFLDMTGFYLGDKCLVTTSYKDDGVFFIIYLATVILFIIKEKVGKWVSVGWLSMWFITQFISHEWYTVFNGGFMGDMQKKIDYFSDTIHWITIEGRYIPDVYHTVLHILILFALISTIVYAVKIKRANQNT